MFQFHSLHFKGILCYNWKRCSNVNSQWIHTIQMNLRLQWILGMKCNNLPLEHWCFPFSLTTQNFNQTCSFFIPLSLSFAQVQSPKLEKKCSKVNFNQIHIIQIVMMLQYIIGMALNNFQEHWHFFNFYSEQAYFIIYWSFFFSCPFLVGLHNWK